MSDDREAGLAQLLEDLFDQDALVRLLLQRYPRVSRELPRMLSPASQAAQVASILAPSRCSAPRA